jgi:hypothetical protein
VHVVLMDWVLLPEGITPLSGVDDVILEDVENPLETVGLVGATMVEGLVPEFVKTVEVQL